MNKKFLSAILFGALMITSTGTFVSCKDYDDDIEDVQSQVDTNASAISTLTTQLTSLQTALATAQSTADAAKAAAAAAQTEAEKAAKLAESAAAQAKADAIAEAIKEINALKTWVEAQDYVTNEELAAALAPISGKIEGIETGLSDIWTYIDETLTAADQTAMMSIIALQEDLDIQKAALENYEALLEEMGISLSEEIASTREELQQVITSLNNLIEDQNKSLMAEIASTREGLQEALTALGNLLEDTNNDVAGLEEEIAATREGLQEAITGLNNLIADSNKELQEEIAASREELQEALTTLNNLHNADIVTLQNEIGAIYELIGSSITAVNNIANDNAKEIENLWKEIASEDPTSIRSQLGSLASSIDGINSELISLHVLVKSRLSSLVFIPQVYVDGVEGLKYGSFTYNALTLVEKNSQKEIAEEAKTQTIVNPVVYASYHVNPKNADIESVKDKLSFYVKPNLEYISSRAEASADFAMTPEFYSFEDGILTVKVNITGKAATGDMISVFALNVDSVDVTSDYATLYKTDMQDIEIADATPIEEGDYHYRRAIKGIDGTDADAKISDVKPWSATNKDVVVDTTLVYTESLDLNTIVRAHALTATIEDEEIAPASVCSIEDIEKLGLAWKYEVVENYAIGNDTETFQGDFVSLSEEGVLTAKVYDTTGRAAIGRTPIIRVSLIDTNNNDAIVKCAYIKIRIVDTDAKDESIVMNVEDFVYNCTADTNAVSVKEINLKIYNELGLSFEQFTTLYPLFEDYGYEVADPKHIGTVESTEEQEGTVTEATDIVKWIITGDELWDNAGDSVEHVIRYYTSDKSNFVQFVLKSKIAGVQKAYDIQKPDFINEYWDADKTFTKFNVAVPSSTTDEDPDNCTFINNLNSPFVTWPANSTEGTPGILKLDAAVTNIEYFFCAKDVEAIEEIGGIKVNFTVSENGLTLFADTTGMTTKAQIATIENGDDSNKITYNKNSNLAKTLLNTGAMYTFIGAKGYVCGEEAKEVAITFAGEDHFKANFIRPVNIAGEAADEFIDGVDFGEDGSYIALEDLINPTDWRGRSFEDYENYWGYYGPFEITVDTTSAMCDLNGEMQAVPTTVELKQVEVGTFEADTEYGFLTYKNNGTNVSAFNVYVKVAVKYGWGIIYTDYIKVPVASTIAAE